jgi:hypothetical protein
LGAAAATIDFTAIPDTFTHLVIRGQVRGTLAGGSFEMAMRCGEDAIDTGNNYTYAHNHNTGGIVTSGGTSVFQVSRYGVPAATATGGVFGEVQCWIQDYAVVSASRKLIQSFAGYELVKSGCTGLWTNSEKIVERLRFLDNAGGNFDIGSTLSLYGTDDPLVLV